MKGFPDEPIGPLGPLMLEINDRVRSIKRGMSRVELEQILGPPDRTERDAPHPTSAMQNLMEQISGGPTSIEYGSTEPVEALLFYRDPYRPRRRYAVALKGGFVSSVTTETRSVEAGDWAKQ